MAGLGRKVFTAGDVLTASDVQSYLQDQAVMVVASTATRATAIASPTDGMVTYNQTNDQLEAYNGTAWVGMSGLQLVKKQIIGSAVASVTVTGAFNANYDSYKIIVTGGVGSLSAGSLNLTLSGITTAYSYTSIQNDTITPTTLVGSGSSTATSWLYAGGATTGGLSADITLHNPFAARAKFGSSAYTRAVAGLSMGNAYYHHGSTSSISDFTLTATTGTLTGGTIYVYGFGV